MKIVPALRKYLRDVPSAGPQHDVLAALALTLAEKLDADSAGSMTASVSRELRAALTALSPAADAVDRELQSLLTELGSA